MLHKATFTNLSFVESSGTNHFNDNQSVNTQFLGAMKDLSGKRVFEDEGPEDIPEDSVTGTNAKETSLLTNSVKPSNVATSFKNIDSQSQAAFLKDIMSSLPEDMIEKALLKDPNQKYDTTESPKSPLPSSNMNGDDSSSSGSLNSFTDDNSEKESVTPSISS